MRRARGGKAKGRKHVVAFDNTLAATNEQPEDDEVMGNEEEDMNEHVEPMEEVSDDNEVSVVYVDVAGTISRM
jgi:hypothetical protein